MKWLVAGVVVIIAIIGAIWFLNRAHPSEALPTENQNVQDLFSSTLPVNTPSPTVGSSTASNPILNTEQDPAKFVQNFYTWYIHYTSKDPGVVLSSDFQKLISVWLTADFADKWSIIAQNIDNDPFLLAQTESESWLNSMQTKTLDRSATESSILVNFGDYASAPSYDVLVHLTYDNGLWKISSVHRGQ